MANIRSAKKRAKQNVVKNAINRNYISSVRTAVKAFQKALAEEGRTEVSVDLFKKAQSKLMKAASRGFIHKNNATRKVTRLGIQLNKTATK